LTTSLLKIKQFAQRHSRERVRARLGTKGEGDVVNRYKIKIKGKITAFLALLRNVGYMVLPEVFKNELCKGFEPRMVTRILLNAGWITPAPDGKASHKPRIKGVGTPRLYVFTDKIWGEE
jgi:hypothetical protein